MYPDFNLSKTISSTDDKHTVGQPDGHTSGGVIHTAAVNRSCDTFISTAGVVTVHSPPLNRITSEELTKQKEWLYITALITYLTTITVYLFMKPSGKLKLSFDLIP